jgi:hypothetical protein
MGVSELATGGDAGGLPDRSEVASARLGAAPDELGIAVGETILQPVTPTTSTMARAAIEPLTLGGTRGWTLLSAPTT